MAWDDLARALALVLVLEGLGPFLAPTGWRTMLARVSSLDERALRTIGLVMMVSGLVVLQFA